MAREVRCKSRGVSRSAVVPHTKLRHVTVTHTQLCTFADTLHQGHAKGVLFVVFYSEPRETIFGYTVEDFLGTMSKIFRALSKICHARSKQFRVLSGSGWQESSGPSGRLGVRGQGVCSLSTISNCSGSGGGRSHQVRQDVWESGVRVSAVCPQSRIVGGQGGLVCLLVGVTQKKCTDVL